MNRIIELFILSCSCFILYSEVSSPEWKFFSYDNFLAFVIFFISVILYVN